MQFPTLSAHSDSRPALGNNGVRGQFKKLFSHTCTLHTMFYAHVYVVEHSFQFQRIVGLG